MFPNRTQLSPLEEVLFQTWTRAHGVDDHDDPNNLFDHRGLYKRTGGLVLPPGVLRDMAQAHNQANQPQEGGDVTFPDPYMAQAEMHGNMLKYQGDQQKAQMQFSLEDKKHQNKLELERMKQEYKAKLDAQKLQMQQQQAEQDRMMRAQEAEAARQQASQDMQMQRQWAQEDQATQRQFQVEDQAQQAAQQPPMGGQPSGMGGGSPFEKPQMNPLESQMMNRQPGGLDSGSI